MDQTSIGVQLRTARQHQSLSLRDLAARADVSASLLSQIENGKANPSVATLYTLAEALSLPVDYFLSGGGVAGSTGTDISTRNRVAEAAPASSECQTHSEGTAGSEHLSPAEAARMRSVRLATPTPVRRLTSSPIVRSGTRAMIELMGGVTWERLTAETEAQIEFLEIRYAPGATSGITMSYHTGREFGLVLEGELLLELGFEQYNLSPGDSVIFDSNTPHRLTNPGEVPLRALWVVFAPA